MSAIGVRIGSYPRSARAETLHARDDVLDDAGLVRRIAARDARAFACLYDRYGTAAHGLALRVLRDPSLAEDAV